MQRARVVKQGAVRFSEELLKLVVAHQTDTNLPIESSRRSLVPKPLQSPSLITRFYE